MFNKDFYPTPSNVIEMMLQGHDITDKTILEPSAGKGNIVDSLLSNGAKNVIACENNEDLRKILATKCSLIENDFLKLTSDKISHIDFIVMNPPFSADDKHILHAWNIAPEGCKIIALCNLATVENQTYKDRQTLGTIIEGYGNFVDLGQCFEEAERRTGVEVAMITLHKPGENTNKEFERFFLTEDPAEQQENGIMPYNVIRDLVQRYIGAVKIYDEQLSAAVKMNELTSGFYSSDIGMSITQEDKPVQRNEFKKAMQKSGWKFIFDKLNMQKYATKGLREDINKFVEKQTQIPFTMQNIYKMLEIIVGTQEQRMDKAILEVFDKLTLHYDDNRFNVEGWKTNSHYLMNEKFILPGMCAQSKYRTGNKIDPNFGSYFDLVDDMLKALCYISGDNYDNFLSLYTTVRHEHFIKYNDKYEAFNSDIHFNGAMSKAEELRKQGINAKYEYLPKEYGTIFEWGYFEVKAFKKGTMHFKFKDAELWGKFNQRVAKLKGYPLYEAVKTKETEKREEETAKRYRPTVKPVVLSTIKIKQTELNIQQ